MAVAALKQKPILKTFQATVDVTRATRELLSADAGYRCPIGDSVNIEVERVED